MVAASTPISAAPTRRFFRLRWLAVIVPVALVAQSFVLWRAAVRVRAVVYNDAPAALAAVTLQCGGERTELGDLDPEGSRYVWFSPSEDGPELRLTWQDRDLRRESTWAVAPGERLTIRVTEEGEAAATRERSLGRRLADWFSDV